MIYEQGSSRLSDRYLTLLMAVLIGYAIIGKGVAYLGVAPVFIGEISYLLGVAVLVQSRCMFASMTTLPSIVLAAMMAWVLARTLPFVSEFGFDALRDSVVIMYGGFAFIVAALLIEEPRRLETILNSYRVFVNVFVAAIPFVLLMGRYFRDYIPLYPGYGFPIVEVRTGEAAVHLAGAAIFSIVGFRKITASWLVLMATGVALVAVGRAAILAFVVPVVAATILRGKSRQLAKVVTVAAACLGAAYAYETSVGDYQEAKNSESRSLGVEQLVENAESILGEGGDQTEGTKKWRLDWWSVIIADTVNGPDFWTGRGFGLNLADADGFQDGDHPDRPPLRSPHNVQMTILARAGVPGLALWAAFLATWFGTMFGVTLLTWRRDQLQWASVFLFIACYAMSFVINASFDVALEGPLQGIWFWCLIGLGIGSTMVYRHHTNGDT
jgi:O-Antigen ligase